MDKLLKERNVHSFRFMDMCAQSLSHVQFFATPWTVSHQVPLSMGFSKQEYWSGLSFPPPWDLPDPGIEPTSPVSPVLAIGFFTTEQSWVLLLLKKKKKKKFTNTKASPQTVTEARRS